MVEYMPLAFISMPGGLEWVVIALVALLLFGKRLPEVARSIGTAINELKKGLSGQEEPPKTTPGAQPNEKTEASAEKKEKD